MPADLRRPPPARGGAGNPGGRPAAPVRHDDRRGPGRSHGLAPLSADTAAFPPEIAGFVVVMIGVTIGILGFRSLFGTDTTQAPSAAPLGVAAITLGTMVALNVWTRGAPKLFCALIGMAVGYVVAALLGVLPAADLERLRAAPLVRLPDPSHVHWAFDACEYRTWARRWSCRTSGRATRRSWNRTRASGDWRASCCVATRIGCKRRTARAARRYCFTSTADRM